jgi:hypothetical protein
MRKSWQGQGLGWALPLVIFAPLPIAAQVATQSARTYNLLGISFTPPVSFSEPTAIKTGVAVLYPDTATPGNEDFKMTLIDLPSNNLSENLNDEEMSQWVRFSLLNTTSPPDRQVERTILGRRLVGDVQLRQSRRPTYEETYIVPLSNGHQVVVTFEATAQMPLEQVESMISKVSQTMQELTPKSKEWKDSFKWQKQKK